MHYDMDYCPGINQRKMFYIDLYRVINACLGVLYDLLYSCNDLSDVSAMHARSKG